jgi:putative membrane protein
MPAPMSALASVSKGSRLPLALLALYTVLWAVLAIAPVSRKDWLLENLLVFVAVPLFVVMHRRRPLSSLAYVSLALFYVLHAFGSHYTYSEVPLGHWAKDAFGLTRNHYDRVVHFAFGLLLSLPIFELQTRIWSRRGWWNYFLPIVVTLSFSTMYEMVEWVVASIVSPELGTAYLGTQGDEWDAQKDTALAFLGACLTMAAAAVSARLGHSLLPASQKR